MEERMRRALALLCLMLCSCLAVLLTRANAGDAIADRAHQLHFSSIVLDTHDDTTQRFFSKEFSLGKRNPDGHIDIPRMREGGMNAIFFSIWIDAWPDSSTDKPAHNGLTNFGKDIVREMNRQGIMVDISHVADKTFYDALEVSKAPLIASHSSCRAICNHARNMSDDMIKALAAKGGVIQINYEKSFIDQVYKDAYDKETGGVVQHLSALTKGCNNDEACIARELATLQRKLTAAGKLPRV